MSHELFSCAGRVALVTGGNTGLGRAMALGLVRAGARTAVTGRNPKKNQDVAAELGDSGAVYTLDVRTEPDVERVIGEVVARFGRLDILINNAGLGRAGGLTELSLQEWNEIVALNLTGAFLCSKYAARAMIARAEGGKIINIGSIYSLFGTPNFSSYGASKTGLLGLTRALAVELALHNIQVNALLPGWFVTGRTERIVDSSLGEQIRRKTPAGRWGKPEDLVGAMLFLASAASDFVTGVALPVDGGYAIAERFLHPENG
jgi:2-dehydro-3-deoxy-D-gluconate 5-dehydrogenase